MSSRDPVLTAACLASPKDGHKDLPPKNSILKIRRALAVVSQIAVTPGVVILYRLSMPAVGTVGRENVIASRVVAQQDTELGKNDRQVVLHGPFRDTASTNIRLKPMTAIPRTLPPFGRGQAWQPHFQPHCYQVGKAKVRKYLKYVSDEADRTNDLFHVLEEDSGPARFFATK